MQSLYEDHKFLPCLCLLLPEVEHRLRALFVEANDCPTRLLTAETAEFYTTLAEITAKEFEGRENAAIARLGEPFVELLFDLFILPEGPRLRDKVPFWAQNPVPCYFL